jgi:hypothetical protein
MTLCQACGDPIPYCQCHTAFDDAPVTTSPSVAAVQPASGNLAKQYIIWSIEHNAWWNANRNGYTRSRECAGRYSLEEAEEICSHANECTGNTPFEAFTLAP